MPYRYFRTTFSSVVGGAGTIFLEEAGAYANTAGTGTNLALAASVDGTSTINAPAIWNNGLVNGAADGGTAGDFLTYDFGSSTTIQSMRFYVTAFNAYASRTYGGKIEGSDDNSSWTLLATFSGQNPGTNGENFLVTWTDAGAPAAPTGFRHLDDDLPVGALMRARRMVLRDHPPPMPYRSVPAVGVSGVGWSQRVDFAFPRKGRTDPPSALGLKFIPAVGVSGIAWSQRLDYAFPKKGRTDPPALAPDDRPGTSTIAGVAWAHRFEPHLGRPIKIGERPAYPYKFTPAVGISGVAWTQPLDYAFPRKGRTNPAAIDPKVTPAVGISGVAWAHRFEPFYGKPIRFDMPIAYAAPDMALVPAIGISGMAWWTQWEVWRPLRPFAFTAPPGANFEPYWVVRPIATNATRQPLLRAGGTKGIYWRGRS